MIYLIGRIMCELQETDPLEERIKEIINAKKTKR